MSKAFTKEDADAGPEALPDREISPHRNLVTAEGLKAIEAQISELEAGLAVARSSGDREAMASLARDLRYWSARRASAELMPPPADTKSVQFGSTVTITRSDGRTQTWRIVGEDEADPRRGTLSYVSPLAQALLGKAAGDEAGTGPSAAEITAIG